MTEQRCPMCSHLNPEDVEECTQCGARLTPLSVSPSDEAEIPSDDMAAEVPDWLARIRDQVEDEVEPDPGVSSEASEDEDWLGRLRETTPEDVTPAEEPEPVDVPEPEPEKIDSDTPEWLTRIRSREHPADESTASAEDDAWIDQLRDSTPLEPEPEIPEPEKPEPEPPEPEPLTPEPRAPETPLPEPVVPSEEPRAPGEGGIEEGLRWLEDLALDQDQPSPPVDGVPTPTTPPPSASVPPSVEPEEAEIEDREPSPPPPSEEPEDELPHVPALIMGDEEVDLTGEVFQEGTPEVPDWLGDAGLGEELPEQVEPASEEDVIDLAPATLPAWLEAMRPVDTFRSVVEIEPEEEQAVESVGPLAGLRGVLMAEPVVAMPRSASIGSLQLDVTERHYAQAELLHRMVLEEERETTASPLRTVGQRIIRWAISIVLLIAVSLPILLGGPTFDLPALEPRELGTLYELVNNLPVDSPALLVFDYEPGFSGELDAVAGSFIEQMMMRGIPFATLSTRPTGAPLAVRLINRFDEKHGYVNGESYVHFGYLSGGPTAVQLFAIAPGNAILKGFALPIPLLQAEADVWDASVLEGVQRLEDFSMVAVITAGTESARTWVEQAQPLMEGRPMVMILSAGSEPLIQPYYEAREPQVRGLLSGLPAATAYERRNGTVGMAQIRWDSFGMGMLASEVVLLVGLIIGVTIWWTQRRR